MTTDELIRSLRSWAVAFRVAGNHDCLVRDLEAAADRLESIKAENAFLKDMQKNMVDAVPKETIGVMVENAMKRGGMIIK